MRDTAHLEDPFGIETDGIVALRGGQLIQYGRDLRAEEGRNDRRRSLVSTQTVVVRGTHDGRLEQSVVFVDRRDDIDQEGDELQILRGRFARAHQIDTRIGA